VARARVALPEGDDPLERLAGALMPNLLPISLLEGFGEVRRQSRRRYGEAVNVLVGNYSTDEVQNEFLGRCRAAGRRFAFAQHGGMYLQSPVNAQERLEIEPGARFLSWGGAGDGIVPTPNPYLERLRDSHRGGTRITLVEALEPPDAYVLRFAGHPLGNQGYETAHMLAELVTALPAPRRAHLALKRFPNVLGPPSRPAVLEALPYDGPPGGAAARMATSRLAVIPYLDTPFVEAMVIGTPTLGLWNPAHWPLRIELEPLFERLARAGIVHADPGSAAAHIDGVYDDVASWWERGDVVEARGAFVERFAVSGDALSAWADRLRELRRPR
jgi:putative transferase (TIGR04331 family)